LNPFLEDLLESNLYKYTVDGVQYIIPLWHHELVYDHLGDDLQFICNPILPDNIRVDSKNNLHVKIECDLLQMWKSICASKDGVYSISLTSDDRYLFQIPSKSITLDSGIQTILFLNQGIARENQEKIYDISTKGDILVYLTILPICDT